MAVALSAMTLGLGLLSDGPPGWPGVDTVVDLALHVMSGTVGGAVGARVAQRRRWVAVFEAGIEIAERGAPVLIEWSNISHASVRRWGLLAVLEVVPTDLQLVRQTGPGAQVPIVRQVTAGRGFRFDIGMFWPTSGVLRAALARRLPDPSA